MRILVTIPHYSRAAQSRSTREGGDDEPETANQSTIHRTINALHQQFGPAQRIVNHAERRVDEANVANRHELHIVVVTPPTRHDLSSVAASRESIEQHIVHNEPQHLGFHCHRIMRDRWGNYDYYAYVEDDLIIHDAWLFDKLQWFNDHVGDDCVLLPNRYECGYGPVVRKCYLDGDLAPHVTAPFQDRSNQSELTSYVLGKPVRFIRPLNPHAGCFFLNASQLQRWSTQTSFAEPTTSFIDALKSAATLGIMQTFRVYKPASEHANFLDVEHANGHNIARVNV